ncbi:hypothetical protein LTR33_012831 [Friedmanniomyces endolithicus]|nr:hypothetical protein LTR33_012831 [Friedmanniomyces endolithicus]
MPSEHIRLIALRSVEPVLVYRAPAADQPLQHTASHRVTLVLWIAGPVLTFQVPIHSQLAKSGALETPSFDTSLHFVKMDNRARTPEGLMTVSELEHWQAGALLGTLFLPFILWALFSRHYRSLNKIYAFLVPSACLLTILAGVAFVKLMIYGDISINFLGLHIRWYAILPSTCEATSQVLGHHNALPCHIERLQEWISLVKSGGSWSQVLTRRVAMNASTLTGVLLGYGVLGYLSCKLATWFLWCESCQQERKQNDWPEAGYGGGNREGTGWPVCKRCQITRLVALDAKSPEMLLGPDAMV